MEDYVGFEAKLGRQKAGIMLRRRVDAPLAAGQSMDEGIIPDAATIARLYDAWLPVGRHRCLEGDELACGGPSVCLARCTSTYWRQHMQDVGEMMRRLAVVLGKDPVLWKAAGELHDLDYLKNPHHDNSTSSEAAHPIAVATWLFEASAPLSMVVAILEHSPHIGMPPSTLMSHALVACDEHATMAAANQNPDYPEDIPPQLTACLFLRPGEPILAHPRSDVRDRAVAALRGLSHAR